jgi:pimeloyl-ACP methyl ester carboxylesterase
MGGLKGIGLVGVVIALVAVGVVGVALWRLNVASDGVRITHAEVQATPVTIYTPDHGQLGPAVVIAHGFAGSEVLMQSFALTFARNGYVAVTFDFPGHGRNPKPLTGSITDETGATRVLVGETERIVALARTLGDGRVALLGHSMASDIVVRAAEETPEVMATIAVSMFSPAVTATAPRNLLVIVGDWESTLKDEALRAVGLATGPLKPEAGHTYGDIAAGTARRAAFSPHVEHASVLFSQTSMSEALDWLNGTFGVHRTDPPVLDDRGPWIVALIAAILVLAWPLSRLLPRVAEPAIGAGLGWRRMWLPVVLPMVTTPVILRFVPTHFLPILVGDYLSVHFAVYGVLTWGCVWFIARRAPAAPHARVAIPAFIAATLAACGYGFIGFVWPINTFVTSFWPGPERLPLIGAMLIGTLAYFLADEWLTRGRGHARGAYAATKLAFLVSLAIAIALDFERLFFLIIILPVILLFFLLFGLFSGWIDRRTGHPLVAAIANAVIFAWAIGVTFPILAG